jgi:uncharacterized protein YndB with AHSA1/START domain
MTGEITLVRTIAASRDLVYQAWTDPAELGWFFNPSQVSTVPIEVDLREGGSFVVEMIINDDFRYFTGGIYLELVPPERIVFAFGSTDGWPKLDPDNLDNAPIVTVTLDDVDGSTLLTLAMTVPDRFADDFEPMQAGWGDTIDRVVAKFAS